MDVLIFEYVPEIGIFSPSTLILALETRGCNKSTSIVTLVNLSLDRNSAAWSNLTKCPAYATICSNASQVNNADDKSGKWCQITAEK